MTRVLVTGMSGTGKSSVTLALAGHGFTAIDTDSDEWSEWAPGEPDWIWREDRMLALLTAPRNAPLFVAGCKTNQGRFYGHFEHVVLLSAPLPVLLERVARRTNNPYGKGDEERRQIAEYVETVEPLLRRTATLELDTSALTVDEVVGRLLRLIGAPPQS